MTPTMEEVKRMLLSMGTEPLFINGHRVDRFYQNVFTVDQPAGALDIYDPVDVDKAASLILNQNTHEVQP